VCVLIGPHPGRGSVRCVRFKSCRTHRRPRGGERGRRGARRPQSRRAGPRATGRRGDGATGRAQREAAGATAGGAHPNGEGRGEGGGGLGGSTEHTGDCNNAVRAERNFEGHETPQSSALNYESLIVNDDVAVKWWRFVESLTVTENV
jgi:hypothetical protein